MNLSIEQLKELIIWAKSQKLKALKVGDVNFEFSDIALLSEMPDISAPKDLSVPASSPRLPDGNQELDEEEKLLFWSTRP